MSTSPAEYSTSMLRYVVGPPGNVALDFTLAMWLFAGVGYGAVLR
ncbi:hypothetical protein AB0L49_46150 [Streptomyces antimycoticus]